MPNIDVTFYPKMSILAGGFMALAKDMGGRSLAEPLKRSIQKVIAPAFYQNIATEGAHSGEDWPELADETITKKGHSSILRDTDKLQRKAGQLNLWTIDGQQGEARADRGNELGIGYGYVHQVGSGPIPERAWQSISVDDLDAIENVFGFWIEERVAHRLGIGAL